MELVIGRIAKSHGIRGEVIVDVRTDEPEQRFAVGNSLTGRLGTLTTKYTVKSARDHSGRLLLSLSEVDDRSAADAIRGTLFIIDSADLPPKDDEDEYYDHELEGLVVRLLDGSTLGTIREVLHSAAGELLLVDVEGRDVLIPFVMAIVPTVNLDDGYVVIDPPEGLLEP